MSFLTRIFPFLLEETKPLSLEKVALLPFEQKQELIQLKTTSPVILAGLVKDKNDDIRALLATRLSSLLKTLKSDDIETSRLLTQAIRQLTEDSVTPVRIALASALKDIANTPSDIARKLADDAERLVAEPIIRYSLSLSDEDLLALITQYPQGWHTQTIAARKSLSSSIMDAVIKTGNLLAGQALLANDTAKISPEALEILQGNPDLALSIRQRNSLKRRLKRDISALIERSLYVFLRNNAHLDKSTTNDVLKKMNQRVNTQDVITETPPELLSEDQLKDVILLGQNEIILKALAIRAQTTEDTVKRMIIDSGAAKPVIALCTKAGLSMSFSVLIQQRLTRLPPTKIIYPKNGTEVPLTPDEIQWQLEFFGLAQY
jgi:uncharacterized protein (DUF2336 family)